MVELSTSTSNKRGPPVTLNFRHIAEVCEATAAEREALAADPIAALRAIPECSPGNRDKAGIAYRGQLVYLDTLDRRYSAGQLAAARAVLFQSGACLSVIGAIESAIIREVA